MCILRFISKQKLTKHMQSVHSNKQQITTTTTTTTTITPYQEELDAITTTTSNTTRKQNLRQTKKQSETTTTTISNNLDNTDEPILSRLGLAQNRFHTKRKGLRLRHTHGELMSNTYQQQQPSKLRSGRLSTTTPSPSTSTNSSTSSTAEEGLFRMPANTLITATTTSSTTNTTTTTTTNIITTTSSYIIDANFYKEVVQNVRHNLLYYLDGKIDNAEEHKCASNLELDVPTLSSTYILKPHLLSGDDGDLSENAELHSASSLSAITAFPTLLTAEQYGEENYGKLGRRRPHTKNSWKWKWPNIKKYKLISEGGKMVKKTKPLMGLRDLSKLDMWTQLTMRHKHEQQQQLAAQNINQRRAEKLRMNEELNAILDKRVLPQIILEQNEQSVIKLEREAFVDDNSTTTTTVARNVLHKNYENDNFLLLFELRRNGSDVIAKAMPTNLPRLVLSGEWARPRCYMCMCCGAKFERLKSLEEHKMFRHAHIYCTHYEVVGRELLANNLLRHLFLPKRALARYNAQLQQESDCLEWPQHKRRASPTMEDESSDSVQSNSRITTNTTTIIATTTNSPTDSLPSSSLSSPITTPTLRTPTKIFAPNEAQLRICTKCQRKCNGAMDLYRHMLDCSGDYVWSMVKKRKYRYYCGSKKRRPCNKHLRYNLELRKTPKQQQKTAENNVNSEERCESSLKNSPTPRQRPSDGEFYFLLFYCKKYPRIVRNVSNVKKCYECELVILIVVTETKTAFTLKKPRPSLNWQEQDRDCLGLGLALSGSLDQPTINCGDKQLRISHQTIAGVAESKSYEF